MPCERFDPAFQLPTERNFGPNASTHSPPYEGCQVCLEASFTFYPSHRPCSMITMDLSAAFTLSAAPRLVGLTCRQRRTRTPDALRASPDIDGETRSYRPLAG